METDLTHIRRWLLEDFKARTSAIVPALLEANPSMTALDLMSAIAEVEAPRPLSPDRRAWLLDLYLVERWAGPVLEPQRLRRLPRPRSEVRNRTKAPERPGPIRQRLRNAPATA